MKIIDGKSIVMDILVCAERKNFISFDMFETILQIIFRLTLPMLLPCLSFSGLTRGHVLQTYFLKHFLCNQCNDGHPHANSI